MEDVSIISEKLTHRVISCLSLIFIIFRSVCVCVYFSIVLSVQRLGQPSRTEDFILFRIS